MVAQTADIPSISFRLPAIEAFPTTLFALNLAGLDSELDSEVTKRLRSLEESLTVDAHLEKALKARNNEVFQENLIKS